MVGNNRQEYSQILSNFARKLTNKESHNIRISYSKKFNCNVKVRVNADNL